ncbi:hypothetical protein [Streptomyces cyaneofuscatus]|nr:hypothetical protein [Streptomyces cyaneofuscatus]
MARPARSLEAQTERDPVQPSLTTPYEAIPENPHRCRARFCDDQEVPRQAIWGKPMAECTVDGSADEPLGRASYLFEGRRVLVSDLVHAGLLGAGTHLTFRQRRSGQEHLDQVTSDGRSELSDGQRFKSPSAPAAAATGRDPYDGWTSWALGNGNLLDAVDGPAARHARLRTPGSRRMPRRQSPSPSGICLAGGGREGGASRRG